MSRPTWASAILGAGCLALLGLAGCSGGLPDTAAPSPPPPMASAPPPAMTPEQPVAPPEQPAASERKFTAMAPIANPDQMSADERRRVYGDRYDRPSHPSRLARSGHAVHPRVSAQAGKSTPKGSTASTRTAPAVAKPMTAPAAPPPPTVIPSPGSAADQSELSWMSVPGAPYLDLPVLGHVASKYVTAAVLLLLAVLLVAIAAVSGQSAGRRRRGVRQAAGAVPRPIVAPPTPHEPVRQRPEWSDAALAPFPHHVDEEADEPIRTREPEPV